MTTKRVTITLVPECRADVPENICDCMEENLAEHASHEFSDDFDPEWFDKTYMHEPPVGSVTSWWTQRRNRSKWPKTGVTQSCTTPGPRRSRNSPPSARCFAVAIRTPPMPSRLSRHGAPRTHRN